MDVWRARVLAHETGHWDVLVTWVNANNPVAIAEGLVMYDYTELTKRAHITDPLQNQQENVYDPAHVIQAVNCRLRF
jgi:hypothetical protein